jgi:hypothetical protein
MEALSKPDSAGMKLFGVYFMLFGVISTVEALLIEVLLYYFPFYYVGKVVFLAWLFFPGYQVSVYLVV